MSPRRCLVLKQLQFGACVLGWIGRRLKNARKLRTRKEEGQVGCRAPKAKSMRNQIQETALLVQTALKRPGFTEFDFGSCTQIVFDFTVCCARAFAMSGADSDAECRASVMEYVYDAMKILLA